MRTAIIGAILLAAACVGTAHAQSTPAFTTDFSGKVAEWVWKQAKRGDPGAQHYFGMLRIVGGGVSKDDCRAHTWLKRAGKQGHVQAQAQVVVIYLAGWCGKGDGKDLVRAYAWFTDRAAGALAAQFSDGGYFEMRGERVGFLTADQLRGHFLDRLTAAEVDLALRLRQKWGLR